MGELLSGSVRREVAPFAPNSKLLDACRRTVKTNRSPLRLTGAQKPRRKMSTFWSRSSSSIPAPVNSDSGSFFSVPRTLPYRGR